MNRILLSSFLVLLTSQARGQTLSITSIQTEVGKRTELVVSIKDIDATMTALQFNLSLPKGMSLASNDVILGEATNNHSLDEEILEKSMDAHASAWAFTRLGLSGVCRYLWNVDEVSSPRFFYVFF